MTGARRQLDLSQTIFALTSGSLPSAVAVVKLSGASAFPIAQKIFRPHSGVLTRVRGMTMGTLVDAQESKLDEIVLLSFVAPQSHTGEDSIEFHCHGSVSIIRSLQQQLVDLGARPAERGEFSYRALLNGKLSAADLDTLGDVYLAKETADLSRIYGRVDEALAARISVLREQLVRLQAILDTAVDFSEEYSTATQHAFEPIEQVTRECSVIIQRYSRLKHGEVVPRLVLAGRPNAGKSSLFNALLCRYRAIVHDEPGTTRDVIEEDIDLGGRRWKLVDTAGVRSGASVAESEGISLGSDYLASSDFWVLVVDGVHGCSAEEDRLLASFAKKPHIVVWNKSDLPGRDPLPGTVRISAKTGDGLEELWDRIRREVGSRDDGGPLPTAVQAARLSNVLAELVPLKTELEGGVPPEFLAERSRRVLSQLESVVGVVETEHVLDRIFRDFCIGK